MIHGGEGWGGGIAILGFRRGEGGINFAVTNSLNWGGGHGGGSCDTYLLVLLALPPLPPRTLCGYTRNLGYRVPVVEFPPKAAVSSVSRF